MCNRLALLSGLSRSMPYSDRHWSKLISIGRQWSALRHFGSMPWFWSALIGTGHWSRESCITVLEVAKIGKMGVINYNTTYWKITIRIPAIHDAKTTKIRPPWYVFAPNSRFSWKWEYLYYTSSVSASVRQSVTLLLIDVALWVPTTKW